jgi:hypothetical protein
VSQDDEPQAAPGDEEERRKRATELREQIERLKSGSPPEDPDLPRRPSPREFTERSVHEETEHEEPNGEES